MPAPAIPTRRERERRLRSLVVDAVAETIPGLRQAIAGQGGDGRSEAANKAIDNLVMGLESFVLRPPNRSDRRGELSRVIQGSGDAFIKLFEGLGFAPWISASRPAFLARRLDAVVLQVCRFLNEADD